MSWASRWLTLTKERFSPLSYFPMIVAFCFANAIYATKAFGFEFRSAEAVAIGILLIISFFFRMRLFDEIKDYDTDLRVNPTRPLARGVLSVSQVKHGLLFFILFELVGSWCFGANAFVIHFVALFYSFMMFEEFFVGDWLRPHLTTYAVLHTVVSVGLGLSSAALLTNSEFFNVPLSALVFFISNWCFFNLFEFARKTFAQDEERETVESYSKIFTLPGAVALSFSQAAIGVVICVTQMSFLSDVSKSVLWLLLIAYALVCAFFVVKKNAQAARLFRNLSGLYLLLQYVLLIVVQVLP